MAEQVTTAADARRHGADRQKMEETAEFMLSYIYHNLPEYPLYNDARLTALPAARRADRISRLPRDLLRNVLARLPVKDAARTAALSSRWRALWRSTPLVLVDIHLLPKAQDFSPTPANTPAAVSRILEAHPGPFACVHLICSRMDGYRAQLARWLQLLAACRQGRPGPRPRQPPVAARRAASRLALHHHHPHPPLRRRLEAAGHGRPAWRLLSQPPGARPLLRRNGARLRRLPRRQEPRPGGPQHRGIHQERLASTSRQPEPAVRPNLWLCSGGHRRGQRSMPRAAHPVITLHAQSWLVRKAQDRRCPQAAHLWIFRAGAGPRGSWHCHHARDKAERKCHAHGCEDSEFGSAFRCLQ
ncbi:hypothetical protein ACQJBY_019616 [Aegilops geniculata]